MSCSWSWNPSVPCAGSNGPAAGATPVNGAVTALGFAHRGAHRPARGPGARPLGRSTTPSGSSTWPAPAPLGRSGRRGPPHGPHLLLLAPPQPHPAPAVALPQRPPRRPGHGRDHLLPLPLGRSALLHRLPPPPGGAHRGVCPSPTWSTKSAFNCATMFHHSNLRLPVAWERRLNRVFVTPRMHGVHHSAVGPETNSNYSVIFSWWDRLNRSLQAQRRAKRTSSSGSPATCGPETTASSPAGPALRPAAPLLALAQRQGVAPVKIARGAGPAGSDGGIMSCRFPSELPKSGSGGAGLQINLSIITIANSLDSAFIPTAIIQVIGLL